MRPEQSSISHVERFEQIKAMLQAFISLIWHRGLLDICDLLDAGTAYGILRSHFERIYGQRRDTCNIGELSRWRSSPRTLGTH